MSLLLQMTNTLMSLSSLVVCIVFLTGFMPAYLLPAYEEVADPPSAPPPPYTPILPAPPPTDPSEEFRPTSVTSTPSDADEPLPATPDPTQTYYLSTDNHNKDLEPGRFRCFTGDSGIEVCDGQDLWKQHGFLEREEGGGDGSK